MQNLIKPFEALEAAFWAQNHPSNIIEWIKEELKKSQLVRQSKWTKSIAVGDKSFVEQIKERIGIRYKGRKILEDDADCHLVTGRQLMAILPNITAKIHFIAILTTNT